MRDAATYLREVRRQRSISQAAAADLTKDSHTAVDRAFVASLESRGIPQTVRKFLVYTHAVGADFRVLHELEILGAEIAEPADGIDYALARTKCMEAARAGEFDIAGAWALAAIEAERARGDEPKHAKSLLLLASVMKEAGRWHAAREFAERAVATRALPRGDHARGLLLIAAANDEVGIPEFAEAIVSAIDPAALDESAELRAYALMTVGVSRSHRGLFEGALDAFEQCESALPSRAAPALRVRLVAHKALAHAHLGHTAAALDLIDEGEMLSADLDVETLTNTLLLLGRAGIACGRLDRAEFVLKRALDTAEKHALNGFVLEAQVALANLAYERGDTATFRRLVRIVSTAVREGRYRHGLVIAVRDLVRQDARGSESGSESKPLG